MDKSTSDINSAVDNSSEGLIWPFKPKRAIRLGQMNYPTRTCNSSQTENSSPIINSAILLARSLVRCFCFGLGG